MNHLKKILKIKVKRSFETSITIHHSTRRNNPEQMNLKYKVCTIKILPRNPLISYVKKLD
jgi:hypothetical protein